MTGYKDSPLHEAVGITPSIEAEYWVTGKVAAWEPEKKVDHDQVDKAS